MLSSQWLNGFEDLSTSHDIRKKVFCLEQNIEESIIMDNNDEQSMHIVIYDEKIPCATARVLLDGDKFLIGKVAVLKEFRGQKIGDFIVRLAIRKAFLSGGEEQFIIAQESAVGFYKKLNFEETGKKYPRGNVIGIEMVHQGDIDCYC